MRHEKVEANHPRMYYAHFWTNTVNNCALCSRGHNLADPVVICALAKIPFHD